MITRVDVDRGRSILEDPANSHNRIWPDLPAVAVIEPGDELVMELRDGWDGQLERSASASLSDLDVNVSHPLTGPVEVRGARAGDLLVVEPITIEPNEVGFTAVVPSFGLLGSMFKDPFLVRWEIAEGVARSPQLPGVAIRGRPFLGCAAVAPSTELFTVATEREAALAARGGAVFLPRSAGAMPATEPYASRALRTIPPRENGGNLDIPQVTVGSRLLLPVHVDGAMLSLGDTHFAQGEGECCGTAIEISATVTVRVSLREGQARRWRPRFPAVEYAEPVSLMERPCFMTMGIPLSDDGENADLDLTLAARRALVEMVDWLEDERGLTREQGYVLASVAADLRVAQVVNVPNGSVVCRLPLDLFETSSGQS